MDERHKMHKVGMDALALHPTHPLVATGGADRLIKLWPYLQEVCCHCGWTVLDWSMLSVL